MFSNRILILFKLVQTRKIKYIYSGLRRRFIFYFNKGYFARQMAKRKGKCSGLGHCCKQTIPWCINFRDNKCSAHKKQPLFCKIFPIDEKDIELSDVKGICGYRFE